MKSTSASRAAIAAAASAILLHSAPAAAGAIALPFPGTGTTYTSAINGTGLIPSGGASGLLSTAGDNVDQTFTGTGITSVNSLKVDFSIDDGLNGSSEQVLISINGTSVGSFVVPDNGGVGGASTYSVSIFFAPIVGNGTYDLTMTLQDTISGGEGSIDFLDGGVFALDGGVRVAAPEPVSLALFGAGLCAIVSSRRRKSRDGQ